MAANSHDTRSSRETTGPRFCVKPLLIFVFGWMLWLGAAESQLRIVVVSDLNGSYGSIDYSRHVDAAVTRIIELKADMVLSTGDMIAGQRRAPHLERAHLEEMWSIFHDRVTNKLRTAGIPLLPTPGNHDASAEPGFALEREVYAETWKQNRPDVEFLEAGHYPFHYSFVMRRVLFAALDATRVGDLPDSQKIWLEDLIARHDTGTTNRIVFGHLPVWPVSRGRESEILGDLNLERIFRDLNVDLYLSGHHHAFYPGVHGGVRHVSQACIGSGPRRLLGQTHPSVRAITLLTIDAAGAIDVEALIGQDFSRPLDWSTLPEAIRYGDVELVRDKP